MLLKMFLALLPFFFFTDSGAAGGADGDGDGGGDGNDDGKGGDGDHREGDDGSDDDGGDDYTELRDTLEKERKDRKRFQRELRDANRRIKDLEDGGKPGNQGDAEELAAAEKRAEEAEKRLREANAKSAIATVATNANAIEAAAIYPLVAGEIEYGDDDEPTNVEDVINEAKEQYPKLFRKAAGRGDGGQGNGSPAPEDFNAMIRRAAGRR